MVFSITLKHIADIGQLPLKPKKRYSRCDCAKMLLTPAVKNVRCDQ